VRWRFPVNQSINDPLSLASEVLKNKQIDNIKDYNIFNLDYIPNKIYIRKEMKQIADYIGDYIVSGIPVNMIIYGNKGSGKTLSVLSLLKAFKELGKLDYSYMKATENPTSYSIFEAIAGIKDTKGYSLTYVMQKALEKIKDKHVIVIDEANVIKDSTILYVLSRDTKAQIILLTQKMLWFKSLEDNIKSSLMPKHIYFEPYDAVELKEILKMRAEQGLKSYSEEGISLISSYVFRNYSSDTRVGIRGLFYTGKENNWTKENIESSLEEAYKEVEYSIIGKLRDIDIIILWALIKDNNTNKAYPIAQDLMNKYIGYSISRRQYNNIVHELSSLDLIDIIKKREGRYYTLEIQFLIDKKFIFNEIEKRFGIKEDQG